MGRDDSFGVTFFVMKRVAGETLGAMLVRGDWYADARVLVPDQLAQSLARVQNVARWSHPELVQLPGPTASAPIAEAEVRNYEAAFREPSFDAHPVFELAFRWLYEH